MEEDIKILEDIIKQFKNNREIFYNINEKEIKALENLIKVYKEKDKDNNDLRKLYRRTAIKLKENEKEELADYFLVQINEVPTFTVDDDIDYYTEYYKLKEENKTLKNAVSEIFNSEDVTDNYIPVYLVKEKIEELKETADEDNMENFIRISALQELLEKRK